jgi:tetratricopeptide (TPR) repeat protein
VTSDARRAGTLINRAADLLDANEPRKALDLTGQALEQLEGDEDTSARLFAGRAHQVRAESYLRLDLTDETIAAYASAELALRGSAEDHVRCLHDAAITFANMGLDDLARQYIDIGVGVSTKLRGPYHEDFVRLQLQLEVYDERSYRDFVRRVRVASEQARDGKASGALQHRMAAAVCEFGSPDEIREIFPLLEALYRENDRLERQIIVLSPLAFLAREPERVTDGLSAAIENVVSRLDSTVETELRAEAYLAFAVVLWSRGQLDQAVGAALEAVALFTASVWHVGSSVVRMMTGDHHSTARHIALLLACEARDGALAAELIESARLPALPDVSDASQKIVYLDASGRRDVTHRPLGPLHPIVVAGRARVAEHYPDSMPVGEPIDLDASIEAVGGTECWWWGSWLGADGYRFWAVRTPEGTYECGGAGDAPGSQLLRAALDATPAAGVKGAAMHGVFSATYRGEEAFSVELGELLIPAPIGEAARKAAGARTTLSVVVASNYLSTLPVVLLGVGALLDGRPARLLEVATVRMAPPLALLASLEPLPRRALPYPIGVVCHDHSDSLEFTGLPTRGHVLGGPRFCARNPGAELATLENLVAALRAIPDERSILAYCGHARRGELGPDLQSNIPLVDGQLTAEHIFTGEIGAAAIPFPERILLAACGSAGSGGTGSGEWLGLTAAALSAGAREVLATAWTIWDLPVTQDLDGALLSALENEQDVAEALRRVQLERLRDWRGAKCDYSELPILHGATEAFPLVWAAYYYIGRPCR